MARIGPGSGGGGSDANLVPPGDYVLALVAFKRKQGRNSGNDYLSCKFEVCGGRLKGQKFWDMLSCDLSKQGTVTRWELLIEGCGVSEYFELGDSNNGTGGEGDENVRRLFIGKPFVARVSKERSGDYTNNRLERIIPRKQWTQEQQDLAFAYVTEQEDGADPDELARDPDEDSGASFPVAEPYGRETRAAQVDYPAPPEDDDIPF